MFCSTNQCCQICAWSRDPTPPCANLSFSFHLFVSLFVSLAFLFTSSFSSTPIFVPLYSPIFINLVQLLVLAKRHSRDICKYEFQKWWMTTFALNLCIWQESEQKTSFRLMNWPRWRSRLANAATTRYARTRFELFLSLWCFKQFFRALTQYQTIIMFDCLT